jgi:hypothetical protein
MSFGFTTPDIHGVTDIEAEAAVLTLGPGAINAGHKFASLRLTFVNDRGEKVSQSVYFPAGYMGRALDIAEAINASGRKAAEDMIAAGDVLVQDAAE